MIGARVIARMPLAFGTYEHELATAIGMEHWRAESRFDLFPLLTGQHLRRRDDARRAPPRVRMLHQLVRKYFQCAHVADDDVGLVGIDLSYEITRRLASQIERVHHMLAQDLGVEATLHLLRPGGLAYVAAPHVRCAHPQTCAGPCIAAHHHGHSANSCAVRVSRERWRFRPQCQG